MKKLENISGSRVQNRNPRTVSQQKWSDIRRTVEKKDWKRGDNFTFPKTRYRYEPVPWEVFMDNTYTTYKTVRSSFIPYVMQDDQRYWILGSFYDFPRDILMDFGGSCIVYDPPRKFLCPGQRQMRNYQHQFGCAMLELNEESKGLLVKPILRSLGANPVTVYRGIDDRYKEFVWFVMVQLNYEEVKDIGSRFAEAPYITGEKLGPIDFYNELDILDPNGKYRTSRNLTDFVNYLQNSVSII